MLKILIGTKCDLFERKIVTDEAINAFAERYRMKYINTSSKMGTNVELAF